MNKYTAPELKVISFIALENINTDGNLEGSNTFNDNSFNKWD